MKLTNSKVIKKLILSIMLVIMLGNFVMPNYSHAISAGKLAEPIFSFITWIGDEILSFLQVKVAGGLPLNDEKNNITYSPGNIFANNIAIFDINFIQPNDKTSAIFIDSEEDIYHKEYSVNQINNELSNNYNKEVYKVENGELKEGETYDEHVKEILAKYELPEESKKVFLGNNYIDGYTRYSNSKYIYTTNYKYNKIEEKIEEITKKEDLEQEFKEKFNEIGFTNDNKVDDGKYEKMIGNIKYISIEQESFNSTTDTIDKTHIIKKITYKETKSTAKELQSTVATWYKALRTFALVGLLSVLVYIGIRIIISSASEDKAKYKKMLSGWVAAICIVFILQYIMVFILNISEQLTGIFQNNGEDTIMTGIREQIGKKKGKDLLEVAGPVVCYLALIILTVVFTIQYLKRVIYMAFLTMVAPLIALTYPLDKIKDGKAQAFSMWLKEYIFNALLQPVHLLLYVMLIGSAQSLVDSNPLYAIVAVGFLIPAEKFFRKMFGMESQTSVGTIGAAAGGAMVMSMLNKLKGKPPKEEGEKQQKVRTADQNGGGAQAPTQGAGDSNAPVRTNPTPGASQPQESAPVNTFENGSGNDSGNDGNAAQLASRATDPGNSTGRNGAGAEQTGGGAGGPSSGNSAGNSSPVQLTRGQKFTRALGAVGDKYIYGKDARKKVWKGARKTITGAAGGLALGTIGLAAGVASGDAGKAFQYAAGGAAAGYIGGSNLGERLNAGRHGITDTFKEGYMGTEAYNNSEIDKQFFASDDYKMIEQDGQIAANGIDPRSAVQGYLSQGVTDGTQIRKLLQKNITPEVYEKWADKNMKDPDKIRQLEKAQINPDEYETYVKTAKLRDIDKICDLKENGIKAETYDAFDQIGISNINTIKKYGKDIEKAKQMRTMAKQLKNSDLSQIDSRTRVPLVVRNLAPGASDEDIKEIWQNIQDFM